MTTMKRQDSPTITLATIETTLGLAVAAAREKYAHLTRRELQVAALMAGGKRNRDIAAELKISVKTLDIHRANVMHKLSARTSTDVANLVNLLRLADAAERLAG